jgi:hypothetical protein
MPCEIELLVADFDRLGVNRINNRRAVRFQASGFQPDNIRAASSA